MNTKYNISKSEIKYRKWIYSPDKGIPMFAIVIRHDGMKFMEVYNLRTKQHEYIPVSYARRKANAIFA